MTEPALEDRVSRLEDELKEVRSKSSNLEELLGLFIVHTDRALIRLEKEMREFKDEMRGFKDEMRDFKDEMRLWREEVDKERKAMNRKWGDLANKMGTIVEDIVAPNVPTIAKQYFGCRELEDFMIRRWRRKPDNPAQRGEFDCIAVCDDKVLMVEVKSPIKQSYLEQFDEFVRRGEFFEYFPEMKDKTFIPIFASLYIPEDAVAFLSNRRIYAMAMKDDVMDLLNPGL